jgi:caa(3)-type oxidase subunit IV
MESSTVAAAASGSDYSSAVYVKVWAALVVLLIVSILGPTLGIRTLTIITAFGVAIVKALLVASYFMHLKVEQKIIWYLLFSMLLAMVLFLSGAMPDIMTEGGVRWTNHAAQELILQHRSGQHESAPHQGGQH